MSLQSASYWALSSSFFAFSSSVSSSCRPSLVQHKSFLPSYSLSCCTAYSSMGSTMKSTSRPRFLSFSMKGEFSTALGLAGDVVDVLLVLLNAGDVVLEGGHLLARLGGVVAKELGELAAVLRILVDAELEVLAERLVELGVVVLVVGDLVEHLEALLDDVLLDDLEDLVLLEHLAGDVEGKVLRVDDALDKGEELGDDVLAVVHDEDAADVELDVVGLLLAVEHVEGGALGDEEHGLELELTLHGEVLHRELLLPVVGEGLVEGGVLILGDLLGSAHPDGLMLVHQGPLVRDLLDGLLLLLLLLVLVLDLGDLALLLGGVVLLSLVVGNLLLGGLLGPQGDGVGDELGVLDEILEAA